MAQTLKLNDFDADLVQRVLLALAARPEACDPVLYAAGVERPIQAEAVAHLVRIANYMDTVSRAG